MLSERVKEFWNTIVLFKQIILFSELDQYNLVGENLQ
jgi:hypothetical protein